MVRSDFKYVFKDIMDRQHFEDNMFFSDPISRVTFFRGIAGSPPAVEHCAVYCILALSLTGLACLSSQCCGLGEHDLMLQDINSKCSSSDISLRQYLRCMM